MLCRKCSTYHGTQDAFDIFGRKLLSNRASGHKFIYHSVLIWSHVVASNGSTGSISYLRSLSAIFSVVTICAIFAILQMCFPFSHVIIFFRTIFQLWCRVLEVTKTYFMISTYSWMLCEGTYLQLLLMNTWGVKRWQLWCLIASGWGLPILVITPYSVFRSMSTTENEK